MQTNVIPFASLSSQPWKNGGGVTREIAAFPKEAAGAGGDFLWRLSMAEVASSGPFSSFPGIDRTLTLLSGAGLKLDFAEGDDAVLDRLLAPYSFSGDRPCHGRLIGGPVRDLNVMSKRGKATHRVRSLLLDEGTWSEALQNEATAVVVGAGEVTARLPDGTSQALALHDTLLLARAVGDPPGYRLTLEGAKRGSRALLVEIDLTP